MAPAELDTLSESLNGMAARLEELIAEITSERDRDRAMLGSLAEGVLAVGPGGEVTVANRRPSATCNSAAPGRPCRWRPCPRS